MQDEDLTHQDAGTQLEGTGLFVCLTTVNVIYIQASPSCDSAFPTI